MLLLRCFGDGADASAVVVYIDRKDGMLATHLLNIGAFEAISVSEISLKGLQEQLADEVPEGPTDTIQ